MLTMADKAEWCSKHSNIVQPFIKMWKEVHELFEKRAKSIITELNETFVLSDIYKQKCLECFAKYF